jgi:hypothetical protein
VTADYQVIIIRAVTEREFLVRFYGHGVCARFSCVIVCREFDCTGGLDMGIKAALFYASHWPLFFQHTTACIIHIHS